MTSGRAPVDRNHDAPVRLVRDVLLECGEATVHRLALLLDLVAEVGQALAASVQHSVDDVRDVTFPVAKLAVLAGRELQVGDGLVAEPAPDRTLRRGRHGLVDAPPDEVEERRGELVGACLATLPEERRHERRLGIGRRFLLVLAVVAGPPLAAHEPEDGRDEEERRDGCEAEHDEAGANGMRLQSVDPLVIASVAVGVGLLLLDDAIERLPSLDAHPGRRGERGASDQGPQLDELVRRDGDRTKGRARAHELDVATNPHGLAPPAQDLPGRRLDADEAIERLVPLVAPDLQIDVDDVVVRDRDAAQRVRDREGARLIARVEVPDDACAVTALFDTEGSRRPGPRLECGLVAPLERDAVLRDRGVDQCLAVAKRDVAIPEREVPGERDLDPLADTERAVLLDVDRDVG